MTWSLRLQYCCEGWLQQRQSCVNEALRKNCLCPHDTSTNITKTNNTPGTLHWVYFTSGTTMPRSLIYVVRSLATHFPSGKKKTWDVYLAYRFPQDNQCLVYNIQYCATAMHHESLSIRLTYAYTANRQ